MTVTVSPTSGCSLEIVAVPLPPTTVTPAERARTKAGLIVTSPAGMVKCPIVSVSL